MNKEYGDRVYSEVSDRYVQLHVKTWEDFMQVEVPFDDNGVRCRIHHLDGDKTNNDILNLVCMTIKEHNSYHAKHKTKKQKDCRKGCTFSEEHIKNLSIAGKGKKVSEETKKKISEANKGKPSVMKGKHLSEETKKKISESKIGLKHHKEGDVWTNKNGNTYTVINNLIVYVSRKIL